MNTSVRRRISLVVAGAAVVGVTAGSAAVHAAPRSAAPAAASAAADPSTPQVPDLPPEKLVVTYKPSASEARSDGAAVDDAEAKGDRTGEELAFERRIAGGAALVDLGGRASERDVAEVMAAFRADPSVARVEPDLRAYPMAAAPNDTEYPSQWDLFEPTGGMNVPGAWDTSTGDAVTVAVIDTGYAPHSDLNAAVVPGYDFITDGSRARDGDGRSASDSRDDDPTDEGDWNTDATACEVRDSSWHGTHVAGTVAATTNNRKGIAGVAPDAKVQPVRVLGTCGGASVDIADAITWASGGTVAGVPVNATPAKVINLSLGGPGACTSVYQNAINQAVSRGSTVVVSAGNSNADSSGFAPANCANVITVAASNREGGRAWYSNYGRGVDVSAPGGETRSDPSEPGSVATPRNGILSTLNSGTRGRGSENYKPYQGTSMAAPHIAGLAALVKSAKPSLTPAQVEAAVKAGARPLPGRCGGGCGSGIADAARTLAAVIDSPAGGGTHSSTADVAVADRATVVSPLTVTGRTGRAPASLRVDVSIRHSWRGDLVIDLVAPDGSTYRLKNADSQDSAADVRATYSVDASGEVANGTWKLQVRDVADGDTGYIDSWGLTF
ncbi:S8 family serine peptidase [Streptomyces sp. NPDC001046]|uniref:S8 family peptidase n=1 Tax=Streptomyces sp. NPDC001046 TaxID=3364543 RepID=UPI00369ABD27